MNEKIDIGGIKGNLCTSLVPSQNFIVVSHGLFSSKDSKKYIELEEMFSKRGFNIIRFDFRGCGESTGDFNQSTLTNRLADLRVILTYLRVKNPGLHIGLFGSSVGGAVCILLCSQDDWPEVKSLVLWSTPCQFTNKDSMPQNLKDDIKQYNIIKASGALPPTLLLHGAQDRIVPVSQAHRLYKSMSDPKELHIFDADHSFSQAPEREKALLLSLNWYKKYI